jgi:hypothetical protein
MIINAAVVRLILVVLAYVAAWVGLIVLVMWSLP